MWQSMESAPKDGTAIIGEVMFSGNSDPCAITVWFENSPMDRCWYEYATHTPVTPLRWFNLPTDNVDDVEGE